MSGNCKAIRGYPRNVFRQMGAFPRDRSNNCYLCQAHKVEGFAGPEYEDLFTQLLVSYKVNPQTVLFVGYSDTASAAGDYSLTRTNRTVFAKVGYAWVL